MNGNHNHNTARHSLYYRGNMQQFYVNFLFMQYVIKIDMHITFAN